MSHVEHKQGAPGGEAVAVYVITASDTRGPDEDKSGQLLKTGIAAAGHRLAGYEIVKDEPDRIREAMFRAAGAKADAVVVNGGTGIARRDRTFEAVSVLLEKRIDGFGELFRMLSWAEIGSAAMLSRATAGVWDGRVVFSIPGSAAAVRLAWEKLIGPELPHLVGELRK